MSVRAELAVPDSKIAQVKRMHGLVGLAVEARECLQAATDTTSAKGTTAARHWLASAERWLDAIDAARDE